MKVAEWMAKAVHDSLEYDCRDLHPDELAMWRACAEKRHDDMPRLVYADWLEEFGGRPEQAEFVRLHVELAAWKKDSPEKSLSGEGIKRHGALKRRIKKLWRDWVGHRGAKSNTNLHFVVYSELEEKLIGEGSPLEVPEINLPMRIEEYKEEWNSPGAVVRRGMIDELGMVPIDWMRHGDFIRENVPVTKVVLHPLYSADEGIRVVICGDYICLADSPGAKNRLFMEGFHRDAVRAQIAKRNGWGMKHFMGDPFRHPQMHEAVCELRWPGVSFKVEPLVRSMFRGPAGSVTPILQWDGNPLLDVRQADNSIRLRLGDRVATENGFVVPCREDSEAFGTVVELNPGGHEGWVRVRLNNLEEDER